MSEITATNPVIEGAPPADSRKQKLLAGLKELRTGGGTLTQFAIDNVLMVVGGALALTGICVVYLGWWGASNTPNLFEQVPYLISGGLLGVAICFVGGFLYFAHWIAELVKEQRRQTDALLDALTELRSGVRTDLDRQTEAVASALSAANGRTTRKRRAAAK